MRRTPKYPGLNKGLSKLPLIPAAVAAALLTLFVSLLAWAGPQEVLNALLVSGDEVTYAVKLSLLTASAASLAALALGIPTAYALSRNEFRGKRVVEAILMLPFAMPPVALGAALLIFFTNTFIGQVANAVLNIVFNIPGIIVAQFVVVYPMVVKVLKSSFDMIDARYEAVARTLGYGRGMVLVKVLLPMAKAGVFAALILAFTRALGEFGATVTLAGATRLKTETLPIAIYLSLSSGDITLTVSLIMVLVAIAATTLIALHHIEKKGVRTL